MLPSSSNKKPLRRAIQEADHWIGVENGDDNDVHYRAIYGDVGNPVKTEEYSEAEFSAIDARFPDVLEHLAAGAYPAIPARSLQNVLGYWENPHFILPVEAHVDPSNRKEHVVQAMFNVKIGSAEGKETLHINYVMHVISKTTQGIAFSDTTFNNSATLRAEWMDSHVGGWRERYNTASALGLDQLSIADHVFFNGPLSAHDYAELKLDVPNDFETQERVVAYYAS